jgi:hypothetical protein
MHNLPIDFIAATLIVCVILQGLSIMLENLHIVSKQIDAHVSWTAADGVTFEEFAVEQVSSSEVMQHEFEQTLPGQLVHANG